MRDLGHLWHRKVVTFRVDNSAFQRSAVKGWSRAERLTLLLRRLFELFACSSSACYALSGCRPRRMCTRTRSRGSMARQRFCVW